MLRVDNRPLASASLSALGLLVLASSAACSPRAKPIEEVPNLLPSADSELDASPAPPSAAPDAGSTKDAKAEAQIDRAVRALEACEPTPDTQFEDCAAFATWTNAERGWFDGTQRDALLVELLGSKRPAVRFVAAGSLGSYASSFYADTKLAAAVLSAAEAEQDALVGPRIAQLVVKLDYASVGMTERATKMLEAHPNRALRLALITDGALLPGGSQLVAARFSDPDPEVRRAVVEGLWLGEEAVACKVYAQALSGKDFLTADKAAHSIGLGARCHQLIGPTLRWAAGVRTVPEGASIAATLGSICEQKEATPAQRLQAGVHAKRFAAKAPQGVRLDALRSVMRCDPKLGHYYVQRFSKDADTQVAELARSLVAKAKAAAAKSTSEAAAKPTSEAAAKPGAQPKGQISITPAAD